VRGLEEEEERVGGLALRERGDKRTAVARGKLGRELDDVDV
jgi:hypothetical protein